MFVFRWVKMKPSLMFGFLIGKDEIVFKMETHKKPCSFLVSLGRGDSSPAVYSSCPKSPPLPLSKFPLRAIVDCTAVQAGVLGSDRGDLDHAFLHKRIL